MTRSLLLTAALSLLLPACVAPPDGMDVPPYADPPEESPDPVLCDEAHPEHTVGLTLCRPGADDGYTLIAPMASNTTWLIDPLGRGVHSWEGMGLPAAAVYLLPNGHLLRTSSRPGNDFGAMVAGGWLEEYGWDGELLWSFEYATDEVIAHHDVEALPNGNYVLIAFEKKTAEEAIAAGRDPATLSPQNDLFPEHLIEVDPSTGSIVWEWHLWDHLVQSFDASKENYGSAAQHPELMELNSGQLMGDGDWAHVNSVDYNEEFDQLLLSSAFHSQIWVIDHSTTTEEAASHSGGRSGKGGDFLYRWGSPSLYGAPGNDLSLDSQHDPEWVAEGLPGAGNILIFNNRGSEGTSQVVEIEPPVTDDGQYHLEPGEAWGPDALSWSYTDPDFFSPIVSGSQRLPNGNTLISEGTTGRLFEVTAEGETVWEYINPVVSDGTITQGDPVQVLFAMPVGDVLENWLFRAERYAPDYPGLANLDLTQPVLPIETYVED